IYKSVGFIERDFHIARNFSTFQPIGARWTRQQVENLKLLWVYVALFLLALFLFFSETIYFGIRLFQLYLKICFLRFRLFKSRLQSRYLRLRLAYARVVLKRLNERKSLN